MPLLTFSVELTGIPILSHTQCGWDHEVPIKQNNQSGRKRSGYVDLIMGRDAGYIDHLIVNTSENWLMDST